MKMKDVEKTLSIPRSHIYYLEREGLFIPTKCSNGYRDFSEQDLLNLKMVLILMKSGVTADTVKKLQNQDITLEDALNWTEMLLRKEVDEMLGSLELIQQIHASNVSYASLPRDSFWEEIQKREHSGQHFRGYYELEDVSGWLTPQVSMERIVNCPHCNSNYRIDLEDYVYNEISNEKSMGQELHHYFNAEDCQCCVCDKKFQIVGSICEYPYGSFDSEQIEVNSIRGGETL
jgi:DNA-binding transcriptional MerR regulator